MSYNRTLKGLCSLSGNFEIIVSLTLAITRYLYYNSSLDAGALRMLSSKSSKSSLDTGILHRPNMFQKFIKRFGVLDSIVAIGGSFMIVPILAFIIYFWIFSNSLSLLEVYTSLDYDDSRAVETDNIGPWTNLVQKDMATRFVTVLTALLRICVTSQDVVICMMLSSLAVDNNPGYATMMRLYQYSNGGPLGILWEFVKASEKMWGLVVFLLAALNLALQLSSTFLLSDFSVVVIPEGINEPLHGTGNCAYAFSNELRGMENMDTVFKKPYASTDFPRFADLNPPRPTDILYRDIVFSKSGKEKMVDSGDTTRAFFLADQKSLSEYNGPARFVKTRVVCVPPDPKSVAISWDPKTTASGTFNVTILLESLSSESIEMLSKTKFVNPASPPAFSPINQRGWTTTVSPDVFNFIVLEDQHADKTDAVFDHINWVLTLMPVFETASLSDAGNETYSEMIRNGTEWTELKFPNPKARLDLSLCGIRHEWVSAYMTAKAVSTTSRSGYITSAFDLDTTSYAFRTSIGLDNKRVLKSKVEDYFYTQEIQGYLGLDTEYPPERPSRVAFKDYPYATNSTSQTEMMIQMNRMSIESYKNDDTYPTLRPDFSKIDGLKLARTMYMTNTTDTAFTPAAASLFNNSLLDLGQLSLSWEALLTVAAGAHYMELKTYLNKYGPCGFRLFKRSQMPTKKQGLYIVCGLVLAHYLLYAFVLVAFLGSEGFRKWVEMEL